MSKNVLKTCRKCIVKTVVTPGMFWVTEYKKNNRLTEIELIKLEALLSHEMKNVKRKLGPEEIFIGQVVAVTDNNSCCRGLITDIFDKNSKHTYEILLIDYGDFINTTASNICQIENDKLREKESVAFKVILHGISPVILDINPDNILSNTVFQKRISKTWSAAAFKFVKSYLEASPFVYVKFLEVNDNVYKGDIYVIVEPGKQLVSLSKLLCDKDFAISNQGNSTTVEGDINEIEKKIPHTALSKRLKSLKLYNSYIGSVESSSQISLSTDNQSCDNKKPVTKYFHERGKSFSDISVYSESLRSDIQGCVVAQEKSFCGSSSSKQSASSSTANLSPAWILKKVQGLSLSSPLKSNVPNSSEESDTTDEVTSHESKGQPTNFYKLIKKNEERKRKMEKSNYC